MGKYSTITVKEELEELKTLRNRERNHSRIHFCKFLCQNNNQS